MTKLWLLISKKDDRVVIDDWVVIVD
jgi:hypothetical protein